MSYYGLLSGLPELQPRKAPPMEVTELRRLCAAYIEPRHEAWLHHFFYQIDLINLNAIIQNKELWMEGGNLDRETLQRWHRSGKIEDMVFEVNNLNFEETKTTALDQLQNHWQVFYDHLRKLSPPNLQELITFEITLKNFYKGYLERRIKKEAGIYFLTGGDFDRFAYNKLLIGDIQAEHPHLAAVLTHFEEEDPYEREEKILKQKWNFYQYQAFFAPFELVGLASWLLQYLDLYKWQQNNAEQGRANLRKFEEKLFTKTKALA